MQGEISIPELIADTVGNAQIRQLFHDLDGSGIHEIERAAVIRLDEFIVIRESETNQSSKVKMYAWGRRHTCGNLCRRYGPRSTYWGAGRPVARSP